MKNFRTLAVIGALLFLANIIYSQEDRNVHLGVHLNPKYTIQNFEEPNLVTGENAANFSAGLDVYFDLTNKIQLVTGLSYFYLRSDYVEPAPTFGCDLSIFPFPTTNVESSFIDNKLNLHYIGLPIDLKVKLLGEKNQVYVKAGVEAFFRVSDTNESRLHECGDDGGVLDSSLNDTPRDIYLNSNLGIGYETALTNKVRIYIEPNIEYSINNLFENQNEVTRIEIIDAFPFPNTDPNSIPVSFNSNTNSNRRHFQIGIAMGVVF